MHKKFITACAAVAAFAAFVIVPTAEAAFLTESGSALAVGSSFTASNTGSVKFTGGFALECEVAHLQGTVTTNSSGTVEGQVPIGAATFSNAGGAPCSSALGATTYTFTTNLCWRAAKGNDNITFTGCGGNIVYDMTTGSVTCKYETASLIGTFTTNSTPTKLTISEQPVKEVGGLFFCPDEGKWDMTFDFYTTGGAAGLTFS
jgi:hypothetical protein